MSAATIRQSRFLLSHLPRGHNNHVLRLSLLDHVDFSIHWFVSILRSGAGLSSLKVALKASGLYHHLKVCSKDGSIGAIGFEVGDTDEKVHNSRHNVVGTILATMTMA